MLCHGERSSFVCVWRKLIGDATKCQGRVLRLGPKVRELDKQQVTRIVVTDRRSRSSSRGFRVFFFSFFYINIHLCIRYDRIPAPYCSRQALPATYSTRKVGPKVKIKRSPRPGQNHKIPPSAISPQPNKSSTSSSHPSTTGVTLLRQEPLLPFLH